MSHHSKQHVRAADGLGDIEAAKDKSLGHVSTGKVAQVIHIVNIQPSLLS
jgi:hypothetical protein